MSEKMKKEMRKAHIGVAWAIVILLVGFPFLHDNDSGMEVLGMGAFAIAMAVPFFLDWREGRMHGKRARHRS